MKLSPPQVAAKHYLQVTDDHFRKAVQNPVQRLHETPRNGSQPQLSQDGETRGIHYSANPCDAVRVCKVAEAGLEEVLESLGDTHFSPDVVLRVVLSALSKLNPSDRELVIQQLLTLNRPE